MYTKARSWLQLTGIVAVIAAVGVVVFLNVRSQPSVSMAAAADKPAGEKARRAAPEFEGGTGWYNTASPIKLKDLKGKIVVLDFWTLCCINCIHTLPDLAKLEKKFENQLVVIGVHSAKFDNEKDGESIRKAILRYQISHPVVNDSKMRIWRTYGVRSWPTVALIDPDGGLVGAVSGEGNYDTLEEAIEKLIKEYRAKKTLNEKPMRFELARATEKGDSPLFFPGKVIADTASKRIFIADSTHHRIVITDLDGKKLAIAGTGESGRADGAFDKATFNDPQGMALRDETLFVADRKNHLIRALDLKAQTVTTIAGTGEQYRSRNSGGRDALKTGLNSPWDLWLNGKELYIAMAGHHQIWVYNIKSKEIHPFAGNGREDIMDGELDRSSFAQPSGLTSDGTSLYVADSEVSAVRAVSLDGKNEVRTLVGEGLFEFGDKDGTGDQVRLQHALGVTYYDGRLYVADTYNSKIKILDPKKRECYTFRGGKEEGWLAERDFYEPGGICAAGDKLYVADTNAHRIRVIDLKTKKLETLKLKGVEAPPIQ
jgi:thiol-disulfide isomerase/thioredoxin